MKIIMTKLMT